MSEMWDKIEDKLDIENNIHSWDIYPHLCDTIIYSNPSHVTLDDINNKLNKDHIKEDGSLIFVKTDLFMEIHSARLMLIKLNELWQETGRKVNIMVHHSDYVFPDSKVEWHSWFDREEIENIFAPQVDANHGFQTTKVHTIGAGFPYEWGGYYVLKPERIEWKKKSNTVVIPPGCNDRGMTPYGPVSPRTTWIPELREQLKPKSWVIGPYPDEYRIGEGGTNHFCRLLNASKFQVCLPGCYGPHPNRFWESLLMHTVPIMRRECWLWKSGMEELCETHNLPCVWIDDWSEVNESLFDMEFDFSSIDKTLTMKYWRDFIYKTIGRSGVLV